MSGGSFLQAFGMIIAIVGGPIGVLIGSALMIAGSAWNAYEARKAAQDALRDMQRNRYGIKVNTRTTQRCIPVVYGETRVGGNILYADTGGPLDSDGVQRNRNLHIVFGISEGPVEEFQEVWLNDIMVWQNTPGMTNINSGFLDTSLRPYIHDLDFRYGCNSQDWYRQINAINVGAEGYLKKTLLSYIKQLIVTKVKVFNKDLDFQDAYPLLASSYIKLHYPEPNYSDAKWQPPWQGIPNVTFTVKGRRVRDIFTDVNTLAWSDNPAHVLFDIMTDKRYGWGIPSSKIDLSSFVDVASWCSGSGVGTMASSQEAIPEEFLATPFLASDYGDFTGTDAGYCKFNLHYACSEILPVVPNSCYRYPIKPGSVEIISNWVHVEHYYGDEFTGPYDTNYERTWVYQDNSAGILVCTSPTNELIAVPFNAGSIDYTTGSVFLNVGYEYVWRYQDEFATWYTKYPSTGISRRIIGKWYVQDAWGGRYGTANQWIASSPYIVKSCAGYGSEILSETDSLSGMLLSTSGGYGFVDYNGGWFDFMFRSYTESGNTPVIHYSQTVHWGYQFNGALFDPQSALDVVRDLCSHFRGYLIYTQGVYQLKVDRTGDPIFSFDDSNIKAGTFTINQAPISERPNRIKIKYTSKMHNYNTMDVVYEPQSPSLPLDIAVNEHIMTLPGIVYEDQAYRMAVTLGRQSQYGTSVEFETGRDGYSLDPGDIVSITHPAAGWSGKQFRIIEMEEKSDETVKISAVEHDNGMFADDLVI